MAKGIQTFTETNSSCGRRTRRLLVALTAVAACTSSGVEGFCSPSLVGSGFQLSYKNALQSKKTTSVLHVTDECENDSSSGSASVSCQEMFRAVSSAVKDIASVGVAMVVACCLLSSPLSAFAEDELATKYGNGKGFDSSLVDQTCLVNQCGLQAKACLKDDPDCRKGLTCTAKCMGDNACITGCMARYGNQNLDNLLKCTIEDNECIKVAILEGGADAFDQAPRPPAPTVANFNMRSMEGTWYKVMGYNPNYDCYACQRNTFAPDRTAKNLLQVDVEFSMPHLLPDGTPALPSTKERERVIGGLGGASIGMNEYSTHEVMEFDNLKDSKNKITLNKGKPNEASYARTAHSEGEMFGLKFWENWYIIGENDPFDSNGAPVPRNEEFKFVYYNGKTRQNTYEGAFVYSRTKELGPNAMKKVYKIANDAGMQPQNFCKIRNGCFPDEVPRLQQQGPTGPFRGILASTKISQLLGVDSVAAASFDSTLMKKFKVSEEFQMQTAGIVNSKRAWWYELGDYLEDPHRHFKLMDSMRQTVDWPDYVKE